VLDGERCGTELDKDNAFRALHQGPGAFDHGQRLGRGIGARSRPQNGFILRKRRSSVVAMTSRNRCAATLAPSSSIATSSGRHAIAGPSTASRATPRRSVELKTPDCPSGKTFCVSHRSLNGTTPNIRISCAVTAAEIDAQHRPPYRARRSNCRASSAQLVERARRIPVAATSTALALVLTARSGARWEARERSAVGEWSSSDSAATCRRYADCEHTSMPRSASCAASPMPPARSVRAQRRARRNS
jgi:hypothetical protein